jgi:hypothetical protein
MTTTTATATDRRPQDDLDAELVTLEQLQARIAYCDEEAGRRELLFGEEVPGEWSAQYAARALYLRGQEENFQDCQDEQGRCLIDELDYIPMLESMLEDYAYQDIYENGDGHEGYAWMLWAKEHEVGDFHCALNEWRLEQGLEPPAWVGDNLCFYEEEED